MQCRFQFAVLFAALVAASLTPGLFAKAIETPGQITAVTVYRGQALVTRQIDVPAGLSEIIVTDLPPQIIPGSLYADSASGIQVRSIRYRTRPVQQDVDDEVRVLVEKIQAVRDELERNQRQVALLAERSAYLDKLETFTAETATKELSHSVLDPAKLREMTEYLFQQRQMIAQQQLDLAKEKRDLEEQLNLLQRQHADLTGSSSRTAREAVLIVNTDDAVDRTLQLRYLVSNATWSPSYTVRAADDRVSMTVNYFASVHQRSGEAWNDVAMTLSTATPSLAAEAPHLTPLTVALQQIAPNGQFDERAYKSARSQIQDRQRILMTNRGDASAMEPAQEAAIDMELNKLADDLQMLELAKTVAMSNTLHAGETVRDEGISVVYHLDGSITLPSRAEQQLLQIASVDLSATFSKIASPLLSDYVYEHAEAVNSSGRVLLAGPIASYIAGEFVGRGHLPTIAAGEAMSVGFGIDSSLRCGRELLTKSDKVQGGNRVVEFTYALTLENFSEHDAAVRLLDRMPIAKQGDDVRITLVDTSLALSDDEAYRKHDRPKGMLRWDLTVPPNATGLDATTVTYTFRMEYDKQMQLADRSGSAPNG